MVDIHYIPLHMGDFQKMIADMDAEEVGAFTCLIIGHFQLGEDGLPDDRRKLARIARVTLKKWKIISPTIFKHFHLQIHPSGNPKLNTFVNDWCVKTIQKIEHKSIINQANAMKRWRTGDADALRSHSRGLAIPEPEPKFKKGMRGGYS